MCCLAQSSLLVPSKITLVLGACGVEIEASRDVRSYRSVTLLASLHSFSPSGWVFALTSVM